MNLEMQKLELIQLILTLKEPQLLETINALLKKSEPPPVRKKRQFGFAKGLTIYIAPDFDDTPPGFEEYMQAPNA